MARPQCLFLFVSLLASFGAAENWPAWHGPNRDSICRETGLLQDWPKDGPKLLWKAKGLGDGYSGPAIVGDVLYTMGNREGKEWVMAKERYFTKQMQNWHGGVILLDGCLYGADDNQLACLEHKTGNVKWSDPTCGKCLLLYADGRLYCRSERGPISLVEATSAGFKLHGRFEQPERSSKSAWPHPVIAGGRLYVRDQDLLLCYEVTK
jgi:outer membrane protein assembly factor BamB